jgi:pilus assembly protein Flp/PilA
MKGVWRKLKDRHGQSLVEYALILALVAIVVITALTALGGKVEDTMQTVGNDLP